MRAPLSAGFIWLTGIWFLVEPRWPHDQKSGVVASANGLLENLSLLGQGVVISFVAYILGSFSVFLFSNRLAQQIHTSTGFEGRLSGLSAAGRASLVQVARDGRQRLEAELALTGMQVADILTQTRPVDVGHLPQQPPALLRIRRNIRRVRGRMARWMSIHWLRTVSYDRHWWQFWLLDADKAFRPPNDPTGPKSADALAEAELAQRILRDLPVVADAQLLGKENEVFSAVDRDQAEVDFRVALVPAVLALGACLAIAGVPEDPWIGVISVPAGGLAASALMFDAARQQRSANELLLSLIEHRRITAPSVSRAAAAASEVADQAPAKVLIRRGEASVRAIRRYMEVVSQVGDSSVFLGPDHWARAAADAESENAKLEDLLAQYRDAIPSGPRAGDVLPLVHNAEVVIDSWLQSSIGASKYDQDLVERTNDRLASVLRDAESELAAYATRIRAAVAVAAASDASRISMATQTHPASLGDR